MGKKGYQRLTDGRLRTQIRHPLDKARRLSIYGRTPAELEARIAMVRDARQRHRYGLATAEDVVRAADGAEERAPKRLRDLWPEAMRLVPDASRADATQAWNNRIEPWFGDSLPWDLTEALMRSWELELRKNGYKPRTVRNSYHYLTKAVGLVVPSHEYPWGRWRPEAPSREPTRPGLTTLEELASILSVAAARDRVRIERGGYADLLVRLCVLFLTGLRQSEAAALGWDDLDIDAEPHLMRVRRATKRRWRRDHPEWDRPRDPPKAHHGKPQLLHPSLVVALLHQRRELESRGWYYDTGPVLPAPSGRRAGQYRDINSVVKPEAMRSLAREAGVRHADSWVTHCTRHSFATLETAAHGGDLRATADRTGHRELRSLEFYLHRLGRGIPSSGLPALDLGLPELPPRRESPEGVEAAALVDLVATSTDRQRAVERRVVEVKRTTARESRRPFLELAREWLETGGRGSRPSAVTLAVKRAYAAAYARERYRQPGEQYRDRWKAAGRRARRAALGAWGKALARAREERSSGSQG